ncbi:hypothetical protein ACVJDU_002544 [Bradyrhizobium diazoefficiens]
MTQRGFPKYWWGQRGKPTADLIKHRSSVDTETDGASLAARPSRQTVIDTLNPTTKRMSLSLSLILVRSCSSAGVQENIKRH